MRKSLELFDSEGRLPDLASRKAEIKAILELMGELGCEKLNQELKSFATGLEDYWAYYQRAEKVYQELVDRYPREIVQALGARLAIGKASDQQQRLLEPQSDWGKKQSSISPMLRAYCLSSLKRSGSKWSRPWMRRSGVRR